MLISLEGNKIFQISSFISINIQLTLRENTVDFDFHKLIQIILVAVPFLMALWVDQQRYECYQET